MEQEKKINANPLLLAIFIIAICGIIYELIIGSISSLLLGDSIKQFSITIGLYMSAMGYGSYLSKHFKKNLFTVFAGIELGIGMIGGLSGILLFSAYAFTKFYTLSMYLIIISIGILVGLEIPIITRIIENERNNLRITLANVLSFDYIGALIGSLAFPLLLLKNLGNVRTAYLVGLINIAVAIMVIFKYGNYLKKAHIMKILSILCAIIILFGFITGKFSANYIEQQFFRDTIIFEKQTQYQNLVLTANGNDIRLFINGNIQFSSLDEYRYHEALVHPAMGIAVRKKNILILGGGDGMAAREILKYPEVDSITLVDIDKEVVDLSRNNSILKRLNSGSLDDKRVHVVNNDAFKYLENNIALFDVVFVDMPDPNDETLNKLYTNVFYRLIRNHLSQYGVAAIQSTSPYFSPKAYWCIRKTVESEGLFTSGYHINVPSFGDWGFTVASRRPFNPEDIHLAADTRYLTEAMIPSLFYFAKDEQIDLNTIEVNTINHPVLLQYYQEGWLGY